MQAAIATHNLRRTYGRVEAVAGLDMVVPAGSIYGFLGPNGAGKTTTIRLLTGLLRATSGSIAIFGLPMPAARMAIARATGSLVETPSLYEHLSGRQNLEITRLLLKLPRSSVAKALEQADLCYAADRRVAGYSLGMKQRLALGRALLGDPRLLILDEPGNGLDPDGLRDLRAVLRRLADAGMTILVSSHQLAEVQQVATEIGVMSNGRLLAQGPVAEVLGRVHNHVEISADKPDVAAAVLASSNYSVSQRGALLRVDAAGGTDRVPDIVSRLVAADIRLSEVRRCAPSLEDLYVQLTNGPQIQSSRFARTS